MDETAKRFQQEQDEYWNGEGGETWLENFDTIDRFLVPLQSIALEAAAAQKGETIIDIGCGTGGTAVALAEQAAPDGQVLGVDISVPLIEEARKRSDAAGVTNVSFEVADAGAYGFASNSADLIFSRFGVMFFGEPYVAFENMRGAMKSDGRMVFACWQEMPKNTFFLVPIMAALEVLPPPEPLPPRAPGPFAFGEKDYVHDIMSKAGYRNIEIVGREAEMAMSDDFGVEQAADFYVSFGPLKRLLDEADESDVAQVRAKVADALAKHVKNGKVSLSGAIWLVHAST